MAGKVGAGSTEILVMVIDTTTIRPATQKKTIRLVISNCSAALDRLVDAISASVLHPEIIVVSEMHMDKIAMITVISVFFIFDPFFNTGFRKVHLHNYKEI